ncbi:uncharacterized protein [Battus philenor]|uniref:uncharacterized protein n=1 Tax=Battus philenor TaxID=42288 RepID=UPI0035CF821F
MRSKYIVVCYIVLFTFSTSNACSMEGVSNWLLPVTLSIYDTNQGIFFQRSTSNIAGINSVTNSEELNAGPYLTVSYNESSEFTIATNSEFQSYEQFETSDLIAVTVVFRCSGGSENTLVFQINVIDTNNHEPLFKPNNTYNFKVTPPLPLRFLINDCVNDIIVRDVDLTTQKIIFEIEDNSYFEIINGTSTTAKEFKASIRTTTFIRRIPEPIILWISATDVDNTGDPPLTTNATIVIEADSEFEFPDDLIFSETFYIATYSDGNQIILQNDIYLLQGYDDQVTFSLEGDNKDLFDLDVDGNRITLRVKSQLSSNFNQIILILKATREHTNDATATIIVNLAEEQIFGFENAYYEGYIVDNSLNISNLTLQEGFDYTNVTINIYSDYSNYFSTNVDQNIITLHMDPLDESILIENNILTLHVVAAINNRTASCIIVLEIIKEDFITPLFERNIYNATYDAVLGVVVENITLIQGYDDTVTVSLTGDYENYFQLVQDGAVFKINASSLPSDVLNEKRLLLIISASKPRTVGAHALIYITMPEARALAFKSLTYSGLLINDSVVLETIELSIDYDEDVTFTLKGEYENHFGLSVNGNQISLNVLYLPENVISENNFVVFTLTATVNNSNQAITTIILEVVKQDVITPVFSQHIYNGNYLNAFEVKFDDIFLIQGFDESLIFRLSGDHAYFFELAHKENNISITLASRIPEELIYNEKILSFNIVAEKSLTVGANAAILVKFPRELTEPVLMSFSKNTYTGHINNSMLLIETITLDKGYRTQTEFNLTGDYASYFAVTNDANIVFIILTEELPIEVTKNNKFIILNIESFYPNAIRGHATILIEIIKEKQLSTPIFDRPYYYGEYSLENQLQFPSTIQLKEKSNENVSFSLEGDNSVWFNLTLLGDGVVLQLTEPLPSEILENKKQLIFIVTAEIINSTNKAKAAIFIAINRVVNETRVLEFDQINYIGVIDNENLDLQTISLVEGFSSEVQFSLNGELASYFLKRTNGSTVSITLENAIPKDVLPNNRIIVLELQASAPQALSAFATIIIQVLEDNEIPSDLDIIRFDESYYIGVYNTTHGLIFTSIITLSEGYDENVQFALVGDKSVWFSLVPVFNGVTISLRSSIPISILAENRQLIFEITAKKPSSVFEAKSAIIITHTYETNKTFILGFEKTSYIGIVNSTTVKLESIVLVEGFTTNVEFSLVGELAYLFTTQVNESIVTIFIQNNIPEEIILNNQVIILELEASAPEALSTNTVIVLEIVKENQVLCQVLKFEEAYYSGVLTKNDGLNFDHVIMLAEGYDETVEFTLEGDYAHWFSINQTEEGLTIILSTPIPIEIQKDKFHFIFTITAKKPESIDARSTIVISLPNDSEDNNNTYFNKLLYKGALYGGSITHENIFVSGYNVTNIDILGDHANFFVAHINTGFVTVEFMESSPVPPDVSYIFLELHASGAGSVLVLEVIDSVNPVLPNITFSSETYVIPVKMSQTGLVGTVSATADNNEPVTYSLLIENVQLKERLFINNEGELHLAAPAGSGVHTVEVVATSIFTRVNGSATVILAVEAADFCSNEIVVPPLIVLDRDEESSHENLVILNATSFGDCHFEMTNRWPIYQTWLYVDERGLHTRAIDREDESIAYMALSQIQIELTLQCDTDNSTIRNRRSLRDNAASISLGPYDYGSHKWVLTDSILYNSRRSFVNLIVNDINDNDPIFVLKENEPIAVGYPSPELEEIILPEMLLELQATDADIGENAALVYWSSEPALAVSPSTGRVHVRNNTELQNNQQLRIHATDRNGLGRTGSINIVVRLLNAEHIAVVTINDAFLENELTILSNLSNALGYEVKTLRRTIISVGTRAMEDISTKNRIAEISVGALLQLYIYGLINREPINVSQLMTDINNNIPISTIASAVSLEDYLENREICTIPDRNTRLLVATIVLAVLLFVIIILFGVWLFLKWRNKFNYDKFSDQNSLSSQNQLPVTSDDPVKPRLNLDDLKRSEKRLQEMLDSPRNQIDTPEVQPEEPEAVLQEDPMERTMYVSPPEHRMPIVIQSIDKLKDAETSDDEDEFGETKKARRKSVVTFNENVEKIIHLEDNTNDPDYEVYRF